MSVATILSAASSLGIRYAVSQAPMYKNIPRQGIAIYNGVEMIVDVLALRYFRTSHPNQNPSATLIASRIIGIAAGMAAASALGFSLGSHLPVASSIFALVAPAAIRIITQDFDNSWFAP